MLREKIKERLDRIYKFIPYTDKQLEELVDRINRIKNTFPKDFTKWSEKSIILITYGNSITRKKESPLFTLNQFLQKYIGNAISHVHILPFFPYSSDDGFSVIDYFQVNPDLGTWQDVQSIGEKYNLMFDLIINHISQHNTWFRNFMEGKDPGKDFFIEVDPHTDLSQVVRPRSLPLLTKYATPSGEKFVWTTFSADQIDLNFGNPLVLLEMLKVLLFYIEKGARIIRLDAIAFLWKETGTKCLHLPQTHEIVKLLHDIMKYIDPSLILITETNVPNKENLSYFGNGDEADMVYQFSLPPLLLHALYTANSTYLFQWADSLSDIPAGCTFFNFTASHDGIGIRPLEGLLPENEIIALIQAIKDQGGYISTKKNSDGSDSPYEMNITYLDALKITRSGHDNLQNERFICSQTLMMSFRGIPAFYIHSLLGTPSYTEGVKLTGINRTINRYKWDALDLIEKLDGNTSHSMILNELLHRIQIRKKEQAFHPDSPQETFYIEPELFILIRGNHKDLIVLANLSGRKKEVDLSEIIPEINMTNDLLEYSHQLTNRIHLDPYQVRWIKKG